MREAGRSGARGQRQRLRSRHGAQRRRQGQQAVALHAQQGHARTHLLEAAIGLAPVQRRADRPGQRRAEQGRVALHDQRADEIQFGSQEVPAAVAQAAAHGAGPTAARPEDPPRRPAARCPRTRPGTPPATAAGLVPRDYYPSPRTAWPRTPSGPCGASTRIAAAPSAGPAGRRPAASPPPRSGPAAPCPLARTAPRTPLPDAPAPPGTARTAPADNLPGPTPPAVPRCVGTACRSAPRSPPPMPADPAACAPASQNPAARGPNRCREADYSGSR